MKLSLAHPIDVPLHRQESRELRLTAIKEDGHDLTFINRCRAVAILDGDDGAIGRRSAPEAL